MLASQALELYGATRHEAAAIEIVGGNVKEVGALSELAEAVVAPDAEQPAYVVLFVVMVKMMALAFGCCFTADRAPPVVCFDEGVVLLDR
jgi:uncharacterized membrane protein